jgi:hypothetical protein
MRYARVVFTPEQVARVRAALHEEDSVLRRAAIAQLATPHELHAFADHHNWDDGVDELRAVIESPMCDRGTALMLYWRTDGVFCREPSEVSAYQREIHDFVLEIERRFLGGSFRSQVIRFDPKDPADLHGDWTLVVRGASRAVPPEMLEATSGERAAKLAL